MTAGEEARALAVSIINGKTGSSGKVNTTSTCLEDTKVWKIALARLDLSSSPKKRLRFHHNCKPKPYC